MFALDAAKKYERDSDINPSNVTIATISMPSGSIDAANDFKYTYLASAKVYRAVHLCPECEKEFVNWLSI